MPLLAEYEKLGISPAVYERGEAVLRGLVDQFSQIDRVAEANQLKVLNAFRQNRASEAHLHGTTGYGYNDLGRSALEAVYADVFHTEDALVRPQIASGTHALAVALSGNLRPGDELLSPVGKPYDTLESVIGSRTAVGSLAEYGVSYRQVELLPDGGFDFAGIEQAITSKTKLATIQRSCGYQNRPSLSVDSIGQLIAFVKKVKPDIICLVDNCYGEFVEFNEPSEVGADLCVGSLIKNPGGGLAPLGGYIVGRRGCVERAAYRLTAPGLGKEVGASLAVLPAFFQGLFLAPTVTAAALKGAVFAAAIYEKAGFPVKPMANEERHDIIQALELGSEEGVMAFCGAIQAAAPIDSHVVPVAAPMPGYDCPVVMAAGTFVSGASIELSADAPLRPPYTVYFQGGLTFPHAKAGVLLSYQRLSGAGLSVP
ncbi:MAG: methionine gamma-lyase family protein [Lachnospiraceae bacterium]|jgi:cystathionine beta-lyase family protein involved in aluminum resistance|nr:methionine gamma-lyase family protein [Lachnospiraceae bacterium]